ncbi:DNA repair protein RecN [Curtanaerobium respiraculi]|uniref:DNA repair protein RecN n=1 Tax=Curtanaerobium respiraculi TaxID=2949669 RepID=UPI0024B3204C|nr:DNA repair protein RecN [Curtanaerobium respiraculi]
MIDEMHVRDIALIEDAALAPARGLTVITGETGAGKTALLSALKLLVGERADATMVRQGTARASVEGRVFSGVGDVEGTVAERTLSADGRSRVHINGSIGSVRQLAELVGSTVDLCGQHEHQRLMRPANHRAMLDTWVAGDIERAANAYRDAWASAKAAADAVETIRAAGDLGSEALDQARYTLNRIAETNPQGGEYEEILEKLPLLENAESLLQATGGAHEALSGEARALDAIGQAVTLLEGMAEVDGSLGEAAQSLREASYVVEDVARDMGAYADTVEYDPQALAQMQERISQLQMLMRTWGPTMDNVFEAWDEARQTISAVEGFEKNLAKAQAAQQDAEERLAAAAAELHSARRDAAPKFADAVTKQMARLELGSAQLVCSVEKQNRERWTAEGPDAVEFLFKPGSGMQARPLAKIASGGEVSRVMLAIKVVLGSADSVETLVFDEVDAGVGGATARSLADVLQDLAETHQVIVVTHLAQVAVRGTVHYTVVKSDGAQPVTTLEAVEGEAREREIARMLSGDASEASLAHARKLLAEAERAR